MNPLEKLSVEDKNLIESYISLYARGGENTETEMQKSESARMPIDYILRLWNTGKSYFLNEIFKDNLIIKVPIEYSIPMEAARDSIYNVEKHPLCDILWVRGYNVNSKPSYWYNNTMVSEEDYITFFDTNGKEINPISEFNPDHLQSSKNYLYGLINCDSDIWDNIYTNDTFIMQLPNKKPLKIVRGMKWIRAVIKAAKYLELNEDLIEDLRQEHSMCINTKTLKGNLCFSIHPLDYMTMSDATFSSCMNWMDRGAYRRGTVEMMNSQSVVVVYLESEHEKLKFWDNFNNKPAYWNMKKWRTLLMVNPAYIASIKSYPYECDELTVQAVQIMSRLVEQTYKDVQYISDINMFENNYWEWKQETNPEYSYYIIKFCADGAMYCDMGTTRHFIICSNLFDYSQSKYVNYCGPTECMFCGEVCSQDDFLDESILYCRDCQFAFDDEQMCYCAECGHRLYIDDAYWCEDDNEYYCEDCFNTGFITCVACGEYVHRYNSVPIVLTYKGITTEKTKWDITEMRRGSHNPFPYTSNGICNDCCNRIQSLLKNENFESDNYYFNWRMRDIKSWMDDYNCTVDNFKIKWVDDEKYIELPYNSIVEENHNTLYNALDIYNKKAAIDIFEYQQQWRDDESSLTKEEIEKIIDC